MKQLVIHLGILIFALVVSSEILSAQSTTLQLPTATSASDFTVRNSSYVLMKLAGDGGFYMQGPLNFGTIPIEGGGTRLLWFPKKAAFRAGEVLNQQWDEPNIGHYSVALGFNTKASGNNTVAMGSRTTASGIYAAAMGYETTASGTASIAVGDGATASGSYAAAFGYRTQASGGSSAAMGYQTTASGTASIALGDGATASGYDAVAIGTAATASAQSAVAIGTSVTSNANYSTAMGRNVSTNLRTGSFIIGDALGGLFTSTADHQMMMRFNGGYVFYTNDNQGAPTGVRLLSGQSSWSTISDSTKKTNFKQADGKYFLSSLSKLKLGSWNYTTQDPKQFRHYGPTAQEIFHYFGHDGIGTIGNDTTLATADMDGIIMICLQALEQKVRDQMSEIRKQKEELDVQKRTIASQERRIQEIERIMHNLVQDKKNLSVNVSEGREQ